MSLLPRPAFASVLLALLLLLVLVVVVAIGAGSVPIPPLRVARLLVAAIGEPWSGPDADSELVILMALRVPRVFVAAMVGAALAVSGAQMQGLFQNAMASSRSRRARPSGSGRGPASARRRRPGRRRP